LECIRVAANNNQITTTHELNKFAKILLHHLIIASSSKPGGRQKVIDGNLHVDVPHGTADGPDEHSRIEAGGDKLTGKLTSPGRDAK